MNNLDLHGLHEALTQGDLSASETIARINQLQRLSPKHPRQGL